jgi:hypothetical protein
MSKTSVLISNFFFHFRRAVFFSNLKFKRGNLFFFGFQEDGHQGYLGDFRRKKQLICHGHVDDLWNEKNLIQYVGSETVRQTVQFNIV